MEIGCEVRDTDAGTKTRLPFIRWFVSNAGHDRKSNKHQNGERSLGYILMKRRRLLLFGRLLMIKMRSNHTWPFCVWGSCKKRSNYNNSVPRGTRSLICPTNWSLYPALP